MSYDWTLYCNPLDFLVFCVIVIITNVDIDDLTTRSSPDLGSRVLFTTTSTSSVFRIFLRHFPYVPLRRLRSSTTINRHARTSGRLTCDVGLVQFGTEMQIDIRTSLCRHRAYIRSSTLTSTNIYVCCRHRQNLAERRIPDRAQHPGHEDRFYVGEIVPDLRSQVG